MVLTTSVSLPCPGFNVLVHGSGVMEVCTPYSDTHGLWFVKCSPNEHILVVISITLPLQPLCTLGVLMCVLSVTPALEDTLMSLSTLLWRRRFMIF